MNLLASVTKGFELLNELLDDFKLSQGRDFGMMGDADGMMGYEGFGEHMMEYGFPHEGASQHRFGGGRMMMH